MTSLIFSRLRKRKRDTFKASDAAEIKKKKKKNCETNPGGTTAAFFYLWLINNLERLDDFRTPSRTI